MPSPTSSVCDTPSRPWIDRGTLHYSFSAPESRVHSRRPSLTASTVESTIANSSTVASASVASDFSASSRASYIGIDGVVRTRSRASINPMLRLPRIINSPRSLPTLHSTDSTPARSTSISTHSTPARSTSMSTSRAALSQSRSLGMFDKGNQPKMFARGNFTLTAMEVGATAFGMPRWEPPSKPHLVPKAARAQLARHRPSPGLTSLPRTVVRGG